MSDTNQNDIGIDAAKLKAAEKAAAAKKSKADEAAAAKAKAAEDAAAAKAEKGLTAKTNIRVGGKFYEAGKKLPANLDAETVAELKALDAI